MAGYMRDGDMGGGGGDGKRNGVNELLNSSREAFGFCSGYGSRNFCTEQELEEVSLLMSEVFQKSSEVMLQSALINLEVFKQRHAKKMEVFGNYYKWKPFAESVYRLFQSGAHIVLTPSNSITIKAMAEAHVGKVFEGKYLLCRTVTPALKMNSIHLIVEDTNTDGARLVLNELESLYPFHPNLIPIGTIFIIQDPKFHTTTETEIGYTMVISNSPSIFILKEVDFSWMESTQQTCSACRCANAAVVCSRWDSNNVPKFTRVVNRNCNDIYPVPRHAREWKRIGDKFIADSNDYQNAVDAYTRGLAMNPNEVKLLQSRCVAFRGLNSYKIALADAESILSLDPNNMTGVNLKAQCLMSLLSYQQALDCLKGKINGSRRHLSELSDSKEEVEELIAQEKLGQYNMVKVMLRATQRLTLAEYKGPLRYKIGPNGNITGVVATKGIPRGKLILVKKALVASVGSDSAIWPALSVLYSEPLSKAILLHNIEYLLACFPEKAKEFYNMLEEAGSPERKLTHDNYVMVRAMYTKAFIPVEGFHPVATMKNSGVFLGFPAHIRHHCVDINCNWQIYGEFLMIRASRDIKKDEELFLVRIDPKDSFEKRLKRFKECGITCDCRLCQADAADGTDIRKKRETLLMEIGETVKDFSKLDIFKLDDQLAKYWAFRTGSPELNIRIFGGTDAITRAYFYRREVSKALRFLDCIRPHLLYTGCYSEFVGSILGMCTGFDQLNQGAKAKEWHAKLKKELEVLMGGPGDKMLEAFLSKKNQRKYHVLGVGVGVGVPK